MEIFGEVSERDIYGGAVEKRSCRPQNRDEEQPLAFWGCESNVALVIGHSAILSAWRILEGNEGTKGAFRLIKDAEISDKQLVR